MRAMVSFVGLRADAHQSPIRIKATEERFGRFAERTSRTPLARMSPRHDSVPGAVQNDDTDAMVCLPSKEDPAPL